MLDVADVVVKIWIPRTFSDALGLQGRYGRMGHAALEYVYHGLREYVSLYPFEGWSAVAVMSSKVTDRDHYRNFQAYTYTIKNLNVARIHQALNRAFPGSGHERIIDDPPYHIRNLPDDNNFFRACICIGSECSSRPAFNCTSLIIYLLQEGGLYLGLYGTDIWRKLLIQSFSAIATGYASADAVDYFRAPSNKVIADDVIALIMLVGAVLTCSVYLLRLILTCYGLGCAITRDNNESSTAVTRESSNYKWYHPSKLASLGVLNILLAFVMVGIKKAYDEPLFLPKDQAEVFVETMLAYGVFALLYVSLQGFFMCSLDWQNCMIRPYGLKDAIESHTSKVEDIPFFRAETDIDRDRAALLMRDVLATREAESKGVSVGGVELA